MNASSIDLEAAKNTIRTHAEHCNPYECCGLIVGRGKKQIVYTGSNIASDPQHQFVLHPEDYAAAEDAGEIIAIYHSHINQPPEPSWADKALAEKQQLPVIILSWPADSWHVYQPSGWKAGFENRPFVYGVMDCFTLLQDYYRETHQIELPDLSYAGKWWERGQNLFMDNLKRFGFVRSTARDIKPSDLIVMQIDAPVPNHCAIYIGDGLMLHHPPDRLSGYCPYVVDRGYFALCTVGFWRHRKLLKL
jgi:proteasome lid subunit RPN8/RPN11